MAIDITDPAFRYVRDQWQDWGWKFTADLEEDDTRLTVTIEKRDKGHRVVLQLDSPGNVPSGDWIRAHKSLEGSLLFSAKAT